MKSKILRYLFSILLIVLSGCTINQEITQKDNIAYLRLLGNTSGISIQIDSGDFKSNEEMESNGIFSLSPGTHSVKIMRDGKVVLHRKLYFANQIIKEVIVK